MGVDEDRVDALLELVGLDETAARRRVGKYSSGMLQRLGLARALLDDPQVLILDEPANGLDPEGMRWMRILLRDFADRGGAVLLSSHLLSEAEAIADRMVIIGGGRIMAQGTRRAAQRDRNSGARTGRRRSMERPDRGRALRPMRPTSGLLLDAEPEAVARAAMADGVVLSSRSVGARRARAPVRYCVPRERPSLGMMIQSAMYASICGPGRSMLTTNRTRTSVGESP